MAEYFATNPCAMVRDVDSGTEKPTFSFFARNPIPARLALLAGDCLQNLRSSLDYLVWELVLATNNQPTDKHMFPVSLTGKSFKKALKGGRLEGIDPAALALIDSLQPYKSGELDAPGTPLAVLDNLVNINKHRRVLMTVMRTTPAKGIIFAKLEDSQFALPTVTTFDHDANFRTTLTPEEVQMHGGLAVFITLQEGAAKGTEISTCLNALGNYVLMDIMPHFERFFI